MDGLEHMQILVCSYRTGKVDHIWTLSRQLTASIVRRSGSPDLTLGRLVRRAVDRIWWAAEKLRSGRKECAQEENPEHVGEHMMSEDSCQLSYKFVSKKVKDSVISHCNDMRMARLNLTSVFQNR